MSVRFYLLPIESLAGKRGPKYLRWRNNPAGLGVPWAMFDYGIQDTALAAADVDAAQHALLAANVDVLAAPQDIDGTIGPAALAVVQNTLESLWIPGQWVTTSHTYREVLRIVAGLFQFAQRHAALHNEALMQGTPNWSLTVGDLSAARRQRINATAASFGYDTSSITLSTTLRQVLKFLGEQWGSAPFHILGVEL